MRDRTIAGGSVDGMDYTLTKRSENQNLKINQTSLMVVNNDSVMAKSKAQEHENEFTVVSNLCWWYCTLYQ